MLSAMWKPAKAGRFVQFTVAPLLFRLRALSQRICELVLHGCRVSVRERVCDCLLIVFGSLELHHVFPR